MTPVQHTLKHLREQGYFPWIVERHIPCRPPKKVDLYNIIDLIAIRLGETVGVQVCGKDYAEHDRKILDSENSLKWLQAGNGLWLISWRPLLKKRGGKATVMTPRIKIYQKADFTAKKEWDYEAILRREA